MDCASLWEKAASEVNNLFLPFLACPFITRRRHGPTTMGTWRVTEGDCVTLWDCATFAINSGLCALVSGLFISRLSGSRSMPRSRCPLAQLRPTRMPADRSTCQKCRAVCGSGFWSLACTKRRAVRLSAFRQCSTSLRRLRNARASAAAQVCADRGGRRIGASTPIRT